MLHWSLLVTRSWRTKPARSMLAILSVALGVGVVVWVTCCYESVRLKVTEVVLEWIGRSHIVVEPERGVLIHTNHFLHTAARNLNEVNRLGLEHSRFRLQRIGELLERRHGRIEAQDLMRVLADHDGYPQSVCSHRKDASSIASYCVDLRRRRLFIKNGPPCTAQIVEVSLESLGL